MQADTGLRGAGLEHREQRGPRDREEVAVRQLGNVPVHLHRHLVRVGGIGDRLERGRIGVVEIALRTGGEADADAERMVRRALFVHVDLRVGVPELEQAGGIQPARPAAKNCDAGESHTAAPCSPLPRCPRGARVFSNLPTLVVESTSSTRGE